jgi:hypothetical protein
MNLTKSKIDGFRYAGQKVENKQGDIRWTRDVRWDAKVPGLGVRITPNNRKAFVLSYRINGSKRLMTLGAYGTLTLEQARQKAIREKAKVIDGQDPLHARQEARDAPTMADLAQDYLARHATQHKRQGSIREDLSMLKNYIRPALRSKRVNSVRRRDIERLHQSLKATPYRANRVLALLSKMFSLAVQWDWRADNPCKGIKKFREEKRDRWLKTGELRRLTDALDRSANYQAADAVRLLILTGARNPRLAQQLPHPCLHLVLGKEAAGLLMHRLCLCAPDVVGLAVGIALAHALRPVGRRLGLLGCEFVQLRLIGHQLHPSTM